MSIDPLKPQLTINREWPGDNKMAAFMHAKGYEVFVSDPCPTCKGYPEKRARCPQCLGAGCIVQAFTMSDKV